MYSHKQTFFQGDVINPLPEVIMSTYSKEQIDNLSDSEKNELLLHENYLLNVSLNQCIKAINRLEAIVNDIDNELCDLINNRFHDLKENKKDENNIS